MLRAVSRTILAGSLGVALVSCVPSSAKRSEEQTVVTEAKPGIQDARLRGVMADLNREVCTCWPQDIEDDYAAANSARAGRALEDACWLAEGLANAASRIPDAIKHVELAEVDRQSFLAQAESLRRQALDLQDKACAGDIDRMRRILTSIRRTCRSCHDRFRSIPGPAEHP